MNWLLKKLGKVIFLALLLCGLGTYASHIVGGEIYYDYLGGDEYRVTLKLYRDCNGINFDGDPAGSVPYPLGLYVFDGDNQLVDSIGVAFPGESQVPAGINYACYQPPADVCVREAIYVTVVTLPANATGYRLVYQRCCRNATIINLTNPGSTGSTYTAYIPPRVTFVQNNSPRYNEFPPIFICANVPLVFDHSAYDPDGDSLVYSLCDAFHGASFNCPYYSPGFVSGSCPSVPDAVPPYVVYNSGYSGSYPLSANPALSIDPQTGLLTGTPNQLGQWVVAVCVSEYRNGQLLSVNKRDFQFNVVNCNSNIVAAIPTQTLFCKGYTVSFGNNSINANTFFWDFGVPSQTGDTSNLATPVFSFPDSGVYNVTLIANPGLPCADTAYEQVKVYPLLDPEFISPAGQCVRGNSFSFSAGGVFTDDATFFWNFGSGATPQTSTSETPSNIVYNTPGIYNVVLTVSQYGCSEPRVHQIEVGALPDPVPGVTPSYCGGNLLSFTNASQNAFSYLWNFGDVSSPDNTSPDTEPSHSFADTGYYNVVLTAINSFCRDSDTIVVHVIPALIPDFDPPLIQCLSTNSFSFGAAGSFYAPEATFQWQFGTAAVPQTSNDKDPTGIVFSQAGIHTVTLQVSQRTCTETVTKEIEVLQDPVAFIEPLPAYCGGFSFDFQNASTNATSYFWDFGVATTGTDTSYQPNASYTFQDTGYFNVQLIAGNRGLCFDTLYTQVHVWPAIEALFSAPAKQCLENNSFSFNAQGTYQPGAQFFWDFGSSGIPAASVDDSPDVVFNAAGTKPVKLVISQYGCSDSITHEIRILEDAVAVIDSQDVFCNGFSYAFGNSSQHSDAWSWNFGVTGVASDTSFRFEPSYTYSDSGTYVVTLIASNEGMCHDTASRSFFIYPLLSPEILVNDPQQCFEGNVFNFSLGGTYSPLTNFQWSFGSNATPDSSTLRQPLPVSYSAPGEYPVTLYAFENGCNKSVQRIVYVFPMPVLDFTATGSGCSPFSVSFSDNSFAATPILYNWDFGDGSSSGLKDPVHIYESPGVYDVSLTIRTDSGCIDTLSLTKQDAITVYQTPVAGFTIDSLSSLEIDPTIIVSDHSQFGYSCSLSFGDGAATGICDTTYTFADTGSYKVTQIVYSLEGCSDTLTKTVRVPPIFRYYIPNAFSPNGDGRNDDFIPVVIGAKTVQFDVYDRWGERIFEGALGQAWDGRYNGRYVQEDVYVYRVRVTDVFNREHSFKGNVTVVK